MTSVLVTGATTPLGRAFVQGLLEKAHGPILAIGAEAAWSHGDTDRRLHYVRADLKRPRDIRRLLFGPARDLGIRVLLHTAPHRSALDRGREMHALNVGSTRELLRLSDRHPTIERFVYRSFAEVYRVAPEHPAVMSEDHPLELSPSMPQRVRDRIEADLAVCTRMGLSSLRTVVLRCAEILCPESGSQLYDYLSSKVCMRPLGYDPMINVLSVPDAVRAVLLAVETNEQGVFNVPGLEVLPLSAAVEAAGRVALAVPGPMLRPLFALRGLVNRGEFVYELNRYRFHFSGVLDGRRAADVLGYRPRQRVDWSLGREATASGRQQP